MNARTIIKAWKDPSYRKSLSREEQAAIPGNPAGVQELDIEMLDRISGATIHSNEGGAICHMESIACSSGGTCQITATACPGVSHTCL